MIRRARAAYTAWQARRRRARTHGPCLPGHHGRHDAVELHAWERHSFEQISNLIGREQ